MSKASDVIKIALAEVGYKEKATNANLDLATANAGTNNWTKYARDLWNAGYYNGNKNGYGKLRPRKVLAPCIASHRLHSFG